MDLLAEPCRLGSGRYSGTSPTMSKSTGDPVGAWTDRHRGGRCTPRIKPHSARDAIA